MGRAASSAETVYVEGADQVYRGYETVVARAIAGWLERVACPGR
jgi:hypothetical protein